MARFAAALPVFVLVAAFGAGLGATPDATAASMVEEGRKLAFERRKGNCVACHIMAGATLAGTVGPPLLAMKARFPGQGEAARPDPGRDDVEPAIAHAAVRAARDPHR